MCVFLTYLIRANLSDFRELKKIAKLKTREIKSSQNLPTLNLKPSLQIYTVKQMNQ